MSKTCTIILAVFFTATTIVSLGTADCRAGEALPSITLTVPENEEYRKYLGLQGSPDDPFTLTDIKADILLIELFSMYCPYCQAEAPVVNELYELAQQQEAKGIVIRLIGLGASNTQFEVNHFKDTYNIAFPLFPDKSLELYKKLGGEGTPGFLGCILPEDKDAKIVLRQSGGLDTAEEFLALLLKKAGYN